jgi:hypothetical protein
VVVVAASTALATSARESIGSVQHSSRVLKRKAEDEDLPGSFKRLKLGINAFTTIPDVVQLAMYGTQLLCVGPSTRRAINWLVRG